MVQLKSDSDSDSEVIIIVAGNDLSLIINIKEPETLETTIFTL